MKKIKAVWRGITKPTNVTADTIFVIISSIVVGAALAIFDIGVDSIIRIFIR